MKIENPFSGGQVRSYLLFYVGVVVAVILFFFAATLWRDPTVHKKRTFETGPSVSKEESVQKQEKKTPEKPGYLIDMGGWR